jgi:glyoxylase-like metal-dependent hydrolase (beta-lactamase superfamily II)
LSKLDDVLDASRYGTLETVVEGVGIVYGPSNVGLVWGNGAALAIDTGSLQSGTKIIEALRRASDEPVQHIVYTHGHVDHVGGASTFVQEARSRGRPRPTVWAHENVLARLMRYQRTWRWNNEVNRRQLRLPRGMNTFPRGLVPPDRTYRDRDDFELAGERVELYHATAETDDATWVWLPDRHIAFVGDLLIGSLPNTGHPNRTQRYTLGWAQALDTVAAHRPRWVVPGHGELLEGDLALEVMTETARALRFLHDCVVERLNDGKWPDEIVEEGIQLPASLANKPYLAETSGCAQFVVRDVLRAYAGWWGGNPSELLPAARGQVARDVVSLAGREAILDRVGKLFIGGEARRALHLAVLLRQADPEDGEAWQTEAELCEALAIAERSTIVRSFYLSCARGARERLAELDEDAKPKR